MNKKITAYPAFVDVDSSNVVDLRDLEAPEPMVQILLACTHLGPDDCYTAHLPHVPGPLFPHLESRGLAWQVQEQTDGSALLSVRKVS
jgi:hypothetical protein